MNKALELAFELLNLCKKKSLLIATAESCTGGLLSSTITDVPGSSEVFDRGFVIYSNEAKTSLLSVPKKIISEHGAVSEAVAKKLSLGAIKKSRADLSISVTGIAGPGGGTKTKPVGLVYISTCIKNSRPKSQRFVFKGARKSVKKQTVVKCLEMLIEQASSF